jgi:hypothetical protein
MHVTKQVRDAVKERLSDAVPALATVAGMGRLQSPFQDHELPAACVDVQESVAIGASDLGPGARQLERMLNVTVRIATRDAEDEIDELRVAVEKAMVMPSDLSLSGSLREWRFVGTTGIGIQQVGDGWVYAKTMGWAGVVKTSDSDPETIN